MGLIKNALGLVGFSWGNVASKLAKPFLGEQGAEMLGIAIDLKNHNIGGVIHNGQDLLEASGGVGGLTGMSSAGAWPSPASAMGGGLGWAGAAAVGGGALLGGRLKGGLGGVGGGLLGGLGGGLLGGGLLGSVAKLGLGHRGLASTALAVFGKGGAFQAETDLRNKMGMTYTNGGPGSRVNALPANACFEDLVAAFMFDVVKDMQDEAKAKMDEIRQSIDQGDAKTATSGIKSFFQGVGNKLTGGAVGNAANAGKGDDSRNLMFEELKNTMQKLAQMQQALSSVINTMHEQAMSAIRHIKV